MTLAPNSPVEAKAYLDHFDPVSHLVYAFDQTYPANSWTQLHTHPWAELVYISSGSMVICTAEANWLITPDKAAWIPPGFYHEWYLPSRANDRSLWLEPTLLLSIQRFSRCHVLKISPLAHELLLYIGQFSPDNLQSAKRRLALTLLIELLVELNEDTFPFSMPRDKRLIELCTSLLDAPGQNVSLEQWAAHLGMSERNLSRLFKAETGYSFRCWRQEQRMRHACSLLKKGEYITSVAMDCGYSSVSAFIATYKQFFGVTPGHQPKI